MKENAFQKADELLLVQSFKLEIVCRAEMRECHSHFLSSTRAGSRELIILYKVNYCLLYLCLLATTVSQPEEEEEEEVFFLGLLCGTCVYALLFLRRESNNKEENIIRQHIRSERSWETNWRARTSTKLKDSFYLLLFVFFLYLEHCMHAWKEK